MAMDAKDLRIESALGAHNDEGNSKYAQSGTTFQSNANKSYHDIGSNSLAKVDVPPARPCAIIGPDRVVPPQSTNDAYVKKVPVEPWQCTDTLYQLPPEYPHKPTEYQHSRNISPRQTFQENMQRIMVPPSYSAAKNGEDHCLKNPKLMSLESKFCDVPYTISPINNEPKIVKNSDGLVLNNNYNQPVLPHGWSSSGVNVRPLRPYGAPELYQYSEYANCPGPRPISMIRPHRNIHEEMPQVYQDRFHEANIRFKPYPTTKERPLQNPHTRYDYIPNYPNAFQPHVSYPPHKYELQKSIPSHPYSVYPPVPLKYLERRMPVPPVDKYPRSPNQQVNMNQHFGNQNMSSSYGSLPGNCLQNRVYPYAQDPASKNMIQNQLYFDNNNSRKYYATSENMFANDNINRPPTIKADLMYPSYPPINMHSLPPHHMYRKENAMKAYEHAMHYRNIDYSTNINPMGRVPLQFSPQTMSISPSDSNASNDTTQILGSVQDDCGYASQSSTASIRSFGSGVHRLSNDIHQRQDMTMPHLNKFGQKVDTSTGSKDKKGLNVRQFLQMWNEGDDEGNDNNKNPMKQKDSSNSSGCYESSNSQEPLYVLGLVTVPKEELGKYDHIQKISKLPENIKGYNSIELLNQYEKLVESPDFNQFSLATSQGKQKDLHVPIRNSFPRHGMELLNSSARPLSPLDVEAKISQSVIHKEVGCNFEIRPCSPQMMNVELATPVHNVLGERLIEKVVNPVKTKSPICQRIEETNNISPSRSSPKVTSCKMVSNQYPSPHLNETVKTNYCLQDLESNSGVCLASLPRLDNDIELNFPEINQQFINDNKISSIRDLPILDTENGDNAHNSKSKTTNQSLNSEHPTLGSDSEKDGSKLSKYRKQKRHLVPNDNDNTVHMSLHRTDSVIIKNPENSKNQEEHVLSGIINNNSTTNIENIGNPLSNFVQKNTDMNNSDKTSCEIVHGNSNDYKSTESNTAIDFSLNKYDEDIQNNSVSTMSNISNVLRNRNEIENKTIHKGTDNPVSQELPEHHEITDSNNISVVEVKSLTLNDITSSKELDDKVALQSVDEDIPRTHESAITHSKSKDIISDTSLKEAIESNNDLPSLSRDVESIETSIIASNITVMSENDSSVTKYIEKQSPNCFSLEHVDNNIVTVGENKNKLDIQNLITHDINIKDMDVDKSNSKTEKEGNLSISEENVPENYSRKHLDNCNTIDNLATQKSEGENIETLSTESGSNENYSRSRLDICNISDNLATQKYEDNNFETPSTESESKEDTPNKKIELLNEISYPERSNDQNTNIMDLEAYDCTDKLSKESDITNINGDCTNHTNSDGHISIAVNELDPKNITCTNSDVSEKSESQFIADEIPEDLTNELKMSPHLLNENSTVELFMSSSQLDVKYKSSFNKKLFSPRIQNLLLYNEGSCSSTISWKEEESSHRPKPVEDEIESDKSLIDDINIDPEYKNNTDSNIKNYETKNSLYASSVKFMELVTSTEESSQCDHASNDIKISLPVFQENDSQINDLNDKSNPESFTAERHDSESMVLVPDEPNKFLDTILDNNINTCDKTNIHIEERGSLSIEWNQLPNKRRTLKRSLSESAVTEYTDTSGDIKSSHDNKCSRKRAKFEASEIFLETQELNENLSSFIHNNRRNSISTICNDENVSFCILIENDCVLTEDNETCPKICYTEISDECLTAICTDQETLNPELTENISHGDIDEFCSEEGPVDSDLTTHNVLICGQGDNYISEIDSEINLYKEPELCPNENELLIQDIEDKTVEETWVDDVACMETVFNDDIAEDIVISAPSSPKESESSEDESGSTKFVYHISENEHTNKVKHIYGQQMCDDDADLVEKLYRTPQMNVNQTLIDREYLLSQEYSRYYDNESLEKILSESNTMDFKADKSLLPSTITDDDIHGNKENLQDFADKECRNDTYQTELPDLTQTELSKDRKVEKYDDCLVHSCESSCDNFVTNKKEEKMQYTISSSPEVSSTTSEEKGPAILLKIRSYKGSKISEVNEMNASFSHTHSHKPLITKAAQKYIPPLKETMHDLKVKIRLPKQSLYKLQQLKKSKEKPKIDTNCSKLYIKNLPHDSLKKAKPKPKFEDVLMSIDEIQFKKHKTKNKKNKQSVPKVIIKKNENGAHYASTQAKETFNPDLTGRKWQPWVFLEKSNFVDKMALKQKFKAVYNHRKKTFVLAENFRKYKSISNAKFVISHPKPNENMSTGNLKYTFRLKHS